MRDGRDRHAGMVRNVFDCRHGLPPLNEFRPNALGKPLRKRFLSNRFFCFLSRKSRRIGRWD
jgi:hypothetical protein